MKIEQVDDLGKHVADLGPRPNGRSGKRKRARRIPSWGIVLDSAREPGDRTRHATSSAVSAFEIRASGPLDGVAASWGKLARGSGTLKGRSTMYEKKADRLRREENERTERAREELFEERYRLAERLWTIFCDWPEDVPESEHYLLRLKRKFACELMAEWIRTSEHKEFLEGMVLHAVQMRMRAGSLGDANTISTAEVLAKSGRNV
jgi:hypothetical protein